MRDDKNRILKCDEHISNKSQVFCIYSAFWHLLEFVAILRPTLGAVLESSQGINIQGAAITKSLPSSRARSRMHVQSGRFDKGNESFPPDQHHQRIDLTPEFHPRFAIL
jgi:hypothetical protein